MQAAVDAVREGHMPVLRASHFYNIPKTTLYDQISGKVLHGSKPGPEFSDSGATSHIQDMRKPKHIQYLINWRY